MDYDVLIVGYGPVGATITNLLARAGISVGVVESTATIYDKPRAVGLDHEALRILQWAGLGEPVDAICIDGSGSDYVGIDGAVIRRYVSMPPPYPLGWRPNVRFIQPELEAILRAGAARYAHVETHLATEALALTQDPDGAALMVSGPDGRTRTLRAKYLIGCDGSTSFVRRQLRTLIEDLAFDEWWIVLDGWVAPDLQLPSGTIQYCWPKRPGTYVPGRDNVRRWEIKLLPGEKPEDFADEASVRAVLRDFVDDTKLTIWRRAVYRFHALVANGWRERRVLLMGDAAHQMPPFMGQGLCSGIRDAGNLWWKLAAVLEGAAPPALLDTYEAERRPHVRELVALTKSVGLIIGELDVARARERDARMRAEIERGQSVVIRQNLIPGLAGGLLARDPDAALARGAGELFLQPFVIAPDGSERRLDDVTGARFLLATPSQEIVQGLDARSRALLERIGARVVRIEGASRTDRAPNVPPRDERVRLDDSVPATMHLRERDTLFADWCRSKSCVAALVRPDRYVFGLADSLASLQALIEQLCARLATGA